jgi:hypothetical protein
LPQLAQVSLLNHHEFIVREHRNSDIKIRHGATPSRHGFPLSERAGTGAGDLSSCAQESLNLTWLEKK